MHLLDAHKPQQNMGTPMPGYQAGAPIPALPLPTLLDDLLEDKENAVMQGDSVESRVEEDNGTDAEVTLLVDYLASLVDWLYTPVCGLRL